MSIVDIKLQTIYRGSIGLFPEFAQVYANLNSMEVMVRQNGVCWLKLIRYQSSYKMSGRNTQYVL